MRQKSDIDVYKIVIYQYDSNVTNDAYLIRYLNTIKIFDILSNQFSIKCLLLERKMKKFVNAKMSF